MTDMIIQSLIRTPLSTGSQVFSLSGTTDNSLYVRTVLLYYGGWRVEYRLLPRKYQGLLESWVLVLTEEMPVYSKSHCNRIAFSTKPVSHKFCSKEIHRF